MGGGVSIVYNYLSVYLSVCLSGSPSTCVHVCIYGHAPPPPRKVNGPDIGRAPPPCGVGCGVPVPSVGWLWGFGFRVCGRFAVKKSRSLQVDKGLGRISSVGV